MKEINELSSREAMHLPVCYASGRFENMSEHIQALKHQPIDELVKVLASCESNLHERYAAGVLLALLGDPRIKVFDPAMIKIKLGYVAIGSSLEEVEAAYLMYQGMGVKREWLMKECPQHVVYLKQFQIAKYPVTNYEYLCFLKGTHFVEIPSSWQYGVYDPTKANHPVYGISPQAADYYAAWLSQKTGRHFRLPTEYEWEYTAAGNERREFPWSNKFDPECANTLESEIYTTTPVGMFPKGASACGCLDMAGNVEEYVANSYVVYPGGKAIIDDLGAQNEYRITRGGSFTRNRDLARSRRRHGFHQKDIYVMGFRLAESI